MSFIALVITNKECAIVKLVHNIEHRTESNSIKIRNNSTKHSKKYMYKIYFKNQQFKEKKICALT